MTAKRKRPQRRNPYHDHPMMNRGGAHGKSKKAQRAADRRELKKQWRYSKADRDLFLNNAMQRIRGVSEGNWFTSRAWSSRHPGSTPGRRSLWGSGKRWPAIGPAIESEQARNNEFLF